MYETVKGVGDVFNGDFVVKNFVDTGIQTGDLPTHFFLVPAAPSGPFLVASTLEDLGATALVISHCLGSQLAYPPHNTIPPGLPAGLKFSSYFVPNSEILCGISQSFQLVLAQFLPT